MIILTLHFLAAFGIAFVLGYSKITWRFRVALAIGEEQRIPIAGWLLALLECPACLGFWLGVGSSFVIQPDVAPEIPYLHLPVLLGFATCGSNLILGRLTHLIQEHHVDGVPDSDSQPKGPDDE